MHMIRIIPKQGAVVRDPDAKGQRLPPEGKLVPGLSPYWRRRLKEGGISILTESPKKEEG